MQFKKKIIKFSLLQSFNNKVSHISADNKYLTKNVFVC